MAASSTCKSLTVCNLGVTFARCTGFTKIHSQNDYSFIIDTEWTDERSQSVKRTYAEFQKLHQDLLRLFPELRKLERSKLQLKTSIRDNVAGLFTKDKRGLAESREAILDNYLINLLKQPERIRHSIIILSFFEPRDSDPKPCKSSSPSEKSDSGIDLSSDRSSQPRSTNKTTPHTQSIGVQHNGCEEIGIQCSPDEHYLDLNCDVQAVRRTQQTEIDDDNLDDYSSDEYETETETESEEDSYNEDYFLDVGYGDLMLQSQTSVEEDQPDIMSPVESGNEKALWCSNLDKFSNILRSSMSNLHSITETQSKSYRTLTSIDEPEDSTGSSSEQIEEVENSETESQQCSAEDRGLPVSQSPIQSSEDECDTYKLSRTNLKNYYLSTNNLTNLE